MGMGAIGTRRKYEWSKARRDGEGVTGMDMHGVREGGKGGGMSHHLVRECDGILSALDAVWMGHEKSALDGRRPWV
jgi:hypothetical protein